MDHEVREIQSGINFRKSSVILGGLKNTKGSLVIMLHGFPDNNETFRHQINALQEKGYRIACPLLPGYESSSLDPSGHYDMDSVAFYLSELIQQIKSNLAIDKKEKVHLVGHDWGAISGFATVCKYPEMFASFTSLTIPYGLSLKGILSRAKAYLPCSWYIQAFQIRGLAEKVLLRKNGRAIGLLIDSWNPKWQMPEKNKSSIIHTLSQPGIIHAALGYYRSIYGLSNREKKARALLVGKIQIPTMTIRGTKDNCIHRSLWKLNQKKYYLNTMKEVPIEAGHFPHIEKSDEVNKVLLNWLQLHT